MAMKAYKFQINSGKVEIWSLRYKNLEAVYDQDDVIAYAKTGTRDQRNYATILTSDGKSWLISRQSLSEFNALAPGHLVHSNFTSLVRLGSISKMIFKRGRLVSIGLASQRSLLPFTPSSKVLASKENNYQIDILSS